MIQIHIHHPGEPNPKSEIGNPKSEIPLPQSDNAHILFLSAECLRLKELLEKAESKISRVQFGNTVLMHTISAAGNELARRGEEIRTLQGDLQNSHASRSQLHDLLRAKDAEIAALTRSNAELMHALQRSQRAD